MCWAWTARLARPPPRRVLRWFLRSLPRQEAEAELADLVGSLFRVGRQPPASWRLRNQLRISGCWYQLDGANFCGRTAEAASVFKFCKSFMQTSCGSGQTPATRPEQKCAI